MPVQVRSLVAHERAALSARFRRVRNLSHAVMVTARCEALRLYVPGLTGVVEGICDTSRMERGVVLAGVDGYERAWRDGDLQAVEHLFTSDALPGITVRGVRGRP